MTNHEIREKWRSLGSETNPLDASLLRSLGLHTTTVEFLADCGFPNQSAPWLSFVDNSGRELDTIQNLSDLYSSDHLSKYIHLGSDGSGNPIAINIEENDVIEILDHEQDFESMGYMNSDVVSLTLCLIEYRSFVKTINSVNSPDAFLKGNYSDEQFQALSSALLSIDRKAAEHGFWAMELDMLKQNRERHLEKTS